MNSGEPEPTNQSAGDSREKWITIDRLCDAYEASLQEGRAERAPFLAGVPVGWREQLMQELDAIDAAYRDAKETREQTVTASPGEVGSRRLPKQSRLAELATLDSNKVWLGRFEIRKRLGTGATGSVWCARDARLARWVALKVPHATRVMSETNAARFQTEARAAAAISHPNVVQVHEVLIEDGLPILIQQWIDGPSLAKYLKEHGPLDFDLAADWMTQIADAVSTAHECGIVHRDVKPANVMLDKNRPMVLDFGLASYPQLSNGLTSEGTVLGTPAYMSPEQAEGGENSNKPPTDIYALGVILYEMLTGAPPFVGKAREVLQASKTSIPVPPRSRRAGVPRDLETITLRCLAKNPAARYRTAADLRDDLIRFRRREPIKARKVSVSENIRVWMRLHPVASLLGAMIPLILMLAIFLGVSQFRQNRLADKLIEETDEKRELVSERYMVQLARASQEISSGDRSRGLALLRDIPPAARQWEWDLLNMVSHSPSHVILDGNASKDLGAPINALAIALGRKQIFAGSEDGKLLRWKLPPQKSMFLRSPQNRARIDTPVVMYSGVFEITDLAVSPDNRWLAWADLDGDVRVWDLDENELSQFLEHPTHTNAYAVGFSTDSKHLVVAGGAQATAQRAADTSSWMTRYDLSDRNAFEKRDSSRWERPAITSLVFTSASEFYTTRGARAAAGQLLNHSDIGLVQRWNFEKESMRSVKMIWRGAAMTGLDYHAGTQRIAWCDEAGTVFLRSLDNDLPKSLSQFRVGRIPITQVRFSPSGRELAVTTVNGGVSRWNIGAPVPIPVEQPALTQTNENDVPESGVKSNSPQAASASQQSAESTSQNNLPVIEHRPAELVRHVKDYYGHESAARDMVYIPPPVVKGREERLHYKLAYLVSGGDDGNVIQWGHEEHQTIDSIELPTQSLFDANWDSDDRIVVLSNSHRKSPLPGYQPRAFESIAVDHRSVRQAKQFASSSFPLSTSGNMQFAAVCGDRIFVLKPGSPTPSHQLDAPAGRRVAFTAACLVNDRFLIAATTRLIKPVKLLKPRSPQAIAENRQTSLYLFDLQRPEAPAELHLNQKDAIESIELSRDQQWMLMGTDNGTLLSMPLNWPGMIAKIAQIQMRQAHGEGSAANSKPTTMTPANVSDSGGSPIAAKESADKQTRPSDQVKNEEAAIKAVHDSVHSFDGHRGAVLDMTLVGNDRIATVGRDGVCRLWDLPRLTERRAKESGFANVAKLMVSASPVTKVDSNTDGTRLATVGEDHMIRIWDTASGLELVSIGPRKSRVMSIEFSPDSEKLLIAEPTGVIEVLWLFGKPDPPFADSAESEDDVLPEAEHLVLDELM